MIIWSPNHPPYPENAPARKSENYGKNRPALQGVPKEQPKSKNQTKPVKLSWTVTIIILKKCFFLRKGGGGKQFRNLDEESQQKINFKT